MITPGEASCSMTFSRTTPPMDYLTTYTLEGSNRLDGTVYLWLTDVLLMASYTIGNSLKPFMTYTSPVTAWAFIQVHTTQQLVLFKNTFSLGLTSHSQSCSWRLNMKFLSVQSHFMSFPHKYTWKQAELHSLLRCKVTLHFYCTFLLIFWNENESN